MYSVTDFNGVNHEYRFVGLKNFIGVFQDEVMRQALFNTLFYTFCTMILINVLSIPLAVFLDKKTKLKSAERAIFFFPSIVSALLLGYIWGYILSPLPTGAGQLPFWEAWACRPLAGPPQAGVRGCVLLP